MKTTGLRRVKCAGANPEIPACVIFPVARLRDLGLVSGSEQLFYRRCAHIDSVGLTHTHTRMLSQRRPRSLMRTRKHPERWTLLLGVSARLSGVHSAGWAAISGLVSSCVLRSMALQAT